MFRVSRIAWALVAVLPVAGAAATPPNLLFIVCDNQQRDLLWRIEETA